METEKVLARPNLVHPNSPLSSVLRKIVYTNKKENMKMKCLAQTHKQKYDYWTQWTFTHFTWWPALAKQKTNTKLGTCTGLSQSWQLYAPRFFWNFIKLQFRRQLVHYAQSNICLLCYSAIPKFLAHCSFRNSLSWLVFMIFGLFNSNPNFSHQYFINCQRFNYSAVVFFRAHHTTLGILLKYNNQVG